MVYTHYVWGSGADGFPADSLDPLAHSVLTITVYRLKKKVSLFKTPEFID